MSENLVNLDCKVETEPTQQASYGLDKIYEFVGSCKRESGKVDKFKIQFSSGTFSDELKVGDFIHISGELRTIKVFSKEDNKKFTRVYIHATSLKIISEPKVYVNSIVIKGYPLAKDATPRKAYSDDSIDVTELVIQVPRSRNKISYIPCTTWNNLARLSANLEKGDIISINGRLQSHIIANGSILVEVSVAYIEKEEKGVD